jgi:putative aldouronate transport system substrate-binding protein
MNKELRAAGMDKIIAEKQKQLDAWVAANKK